MLLGVSTNDGFAVAKKDLEIRGAGEFFGTRQHGEPQMPALMLSSDSRLLMRTREAFLEVMRLDEYEDERMQILEAARRRLAQNDSFFARN